MERKKISLIPRHMILASLSLFLANILLDSDDVDGLKVAKRRWR